MRDEMPEEQPKDETKEQPKERDSYTQPLLTRHEPLTELTGQTELH
jgi:hypothetical protein